MLTTQVTNQEKFNQVSEVSFESASKSIWRNSFNGHVYIQLTNGEEIESDGQHSIKDWEEEFGFIVVEEDEQ